MKISFFIAALLISSSSFANSPTCEDQFIDYLSNTNGPAIKVIDDLLHRAEKAGGDGDKALD
jgi:hypothetical protein